MDAQTPEKPNWVIIVGFWLVVCIMFSARAYFLGDTIPLVSDTDDAMRLTIVKDFLAGQNWNDHAQYRLNTPDFAEIHWSRLVDLPLAGLTILFTPLLGASALSAAAWVWPLLLLLALFWISAALCVKLVGKEGLLPGLILPVLSAVVLIEFAPGRVDHHNVQIILSALMVLASIQAWQKPAWAIVAGLAAATSLAIGIEALPIIMAAVLVYGLGWVIDASKSIAMRNFGLTFGVAACLHLAFSMPMDHWLVPACDALSSVYVFSALAVGIVFVALSFLSALDRVGRLVAGVGAGIIVVAGLVLLYPQCLSGPYAGMDPWLAKNWLNRIIEAKPVWHSVSALPAYTIGIVLPPLLALIAIGLRLMRGSDKLRAEWAILGLFLLAGVVVMVLQVRGARLVAPMVVPAGAWAIVTLRQRYLATNKPADIAMVLVSWLGFSGVVVATIAGLLLPKGSDELPSSSTASTNIAAHTKYDCLQPQAFEDLAGLPPERIMAPVDLGAHMLLYTEHAVVGAPYHRNQAGVLDTFRFFNWPIDDAREILQERGISLVVTCPYLGEMGGFGDTPDTAFIKLLQQDDLPDWIQEVSLSGGILKVYAILN